MYGIIAKDGRNALLEVERWKNTQVMGLYLSKRIIIWKDIKNLVKILRDALNKILEIFLCWTGTDWEKMGKAYYPGQKKLEAFQRFYRNPFTCNISRKDRHFHSNGWKFC